MLAAMKEAARHDMAIVAHCEENTLIQAGAVHEGKFSRKHNIAGIPSVCESVHIARDVLLAEAANAHYHVCHISTKESVRVVRDAKRAGIRVTAEVTPHHLLLNEEDIPSLDTNYKMNPPLRGKADQEALIEGLLDGTIDFIATDHAPHTEAEKAMTLERAPFGIVGLETAFPLLYTHLVKTKVITLKQLVDWLTIAPAKTFGLTCGTLAEGAAADVTVIDLDSSQPIERERFVSKGKNTPFQGWSCQGWPVLTFVGGKKSVGKRSCDTVKRQLILENGAVFAGIGFGAETEMDGEVVFNTGMTGYQELLSDPSYCGQIVTLTYPLIGNYGINRSDFESITPAIHGMIVKEIEMEPSHWRAGDSLDCLLRAKGIPGLAKIDTRKLTRLIREHGTLRGKLCGIEVDVEQTVRQLKMSEWITNQVSLVSTKNNYHIPGKGKRVVLVDFGIKHGILQELIDRFCDVIVVPYRATAEEILRLDPDGVLLSNGPGNPQHVPEAIETIRQLLGQVPLFGICLGHQLFALACDASTSKLRFGHRGSNHPVRELATGKIDITSQNHGYTVDAHSLANTRLEITHVAVNDDTVEGLKHMDMPAFSVQYHPEASPGPHDANDLLQEFMTMMDTFVKKKQRV